MALKSIEFGQLKIFSLKLIISHSFISQTNLIIKPINVFYNNYEVAMTIIYLRMLAIWDRV